MNNYILILIITLIYALNFITSYSINFNNYNYNRDDDVSIQYLRYVDYEDELIKVENKIAQDIHKIITNVDDKFEHEFNINCYPFSNYTCNEFMKMKYNLTITEQETNVINFMYYIFKNITITKKQNTTDNCCNSYLLEW